MKYTYQYECDRGSSQAAKPSLPVPDKPASREQESSKEPSIIVIINIISISVITTTTIIIIIIIIIITSPAQPSQAQPWSAIASRATPQRLPSAREPTKSLASLGGVGVANLNDKSRNLDEDANSRGYARGRGALRVARRRAASISAHSSPASRPCLRVRFQVS